MRSKIVSLTTLKRKLNELRKKKKIIVFTNGCFDILHRGHVQYLQAAKKCGDILVVGLNSDASIRKIKGPRRPIVNQQGRSEVLSALASVDYVVIFDEDTPYHLINAVKPDCLVKGADWKGKEVVGSDIVKQNGGRIKLIKYTANNSTTNIIESVLKKCRK